MFKVSAAKIYLLHSIREKILLFSHCDFPVVELELLDVTPTGSPRLYDWSLNDCSKLWQAWKKWLTTCPQSYDCHPHLLLPDHVIALWLFGNQLACITGCNAQGHVIACRGDFCCFLTKQNKTKHPLDKMDSHLQPPASLNNRGNWFNNRSQNSCKINSAHMVTWLMTATIYDCRLSPNCGCKSRTTYTWSLRNSTCVTKHTFICWRRF